MVQSDYYYGTQGASSLRDKLSETADTIQQASTEAYESVRETVEEQPFIMGVAVGALFGFALGALWKLQSQRSLPAHAYDSFWNYAGPPLRRLRDARW